MTFPTHRTPDDHGPASPASDDTDGVLPTVEPPELSAGSTEQGDGPTGQRGGPAGQSPSPAGPSGGPAGPSGGPAGPSGGPAGPSGGPAGPSGSSTGQTGTPARPWESWEPGVRVMVRTRLPEGSSHLYTDVLGTITDRSDEALTIETRTGTVEVQLASVATGKIVPPAPPRRRPREG
ncbi:hypothetical protein SANBI_002546 [Sanguibacter sp. 4.1]|uniref:Histone acetyltransferase Rv0428c-like SH3 domain-containing protein n=1 Tax=Sanguibacter biliveldensis TaxID=3030830 RepID=A0AAF1C1P1_9MICO|nr:hypothetical protein [Sanguibacter sp. 4.1]WPF81260.1 hypothetical protein SANBI_002546 [Sanguibacter sp. 4.1]